jgi:hypothetical protein
MTRSYERGNNQETKTCNNEFLQKPFVMFNSWPSSQELKLEVQNLSLAGGDLPITALP